eukprot:gb/GECG01006049.1/.p1 GENE.gb/GECG01006049.1/~~gb/GECG01006049.1/.p1  ORF type:complete len:723 (+),score=111.69 gb/GECG01006049.1/:1-2169(+)
MSSKQVGGDIIASASSKAEVAQAKGKSDESATQTGHDKGKRKDAKEGSRTRPVEKLTRSLLSTYKGINEVYYRKKQERLKAKEENAKSSSPSKGSNASVDYEVVKGDCIGEDNRYEIVERLGKGSFGQVVAAWDKIEEKKVAIKIIKNKEAFRKQAETEIRLLKVLNQYDPNDQWCIVRFLGTFDHHGHTCIIFEHLSMNMYELLKRSQFMGVNLFLIRKFARQILRTLAFLSLPNVDIIHCDLKPENILFRVPNRSAVKVLDFGSSCKRNEQMYVYIQSRFYRSPEVILGLPYDQAIDMWSLGCMLVEMHTGSPLFSGRDEHDQITRFVKLKGLPPQWMLERGRKTHRFFDIITPRVTPKKQSSRSEKTEKVPTCESDEDSDTNVPTKGRGQSQGTSGDGSSKKARRVVEEPTRNSTSADCFRSSRSADRRRKAHVQRMRHYRNPCMAFPMPVEYRLRPRTKKYAREPRINTNLREVLMMDKGGPGAKSNRSDDEKRRTHYQYCLFIDLIERMLDYDPKKRIKPMEALNHPFLRDEHGSKGAPEEEEAETTSYNPLLPSPNADEIRHVSEVAPDLRAAVYKEYSLSKRVWEGGVQSNEDDSSGGEPEASQSEVGSGRTFVPQKDLSDTESKFEKWVKKVGQPANTDAHPIPRAFSSATLSSVAANNGDGSANVSDFVHDSSSLFGRKVEAKKPPQAPANSKAETYRQQQRSAPTLPSKSFG